MVETSVFLKSVLDALAANIVVLDSRGEIVFVNQSWKRFASANQCSQGESWDGVNYLAQCQQAQLSGDQDAVCVYQGIMSVLLGQKLTFSYEYPCHSPDQKRWFMMHACAIKVDSVYFVLISHNDITKRKLAEEKANALARLDDLTGVANRRVFNSVLQEELRRCRRNQKSMALAIIDIDYFKCINDAYGHQAGDDCLINVAKLLESFAQRPGDLCARYGGEEFAIIWSGLNLDKAARLAMRLLEAIRALNIPNADSPVLPFVTVSVGLTAVYAGRTYNAEDVIKQADQHMYKAKELGRNQLRY